MNSTYRRICDETGLTVAMAEEYEIELSIAKFDARSVLFKPGDSCEAFLILCEGSIRVEMTAKSGREITLYKMQPSQSCILTTSALLNDELYYAQGVAESEIVAIALSVRDFYKAIQHSARFARYVIQGYASRVSSIIHLVDRMASRDIMFDLCQHLSTNINEEMQIFATQIEIANELGTVREVVGRKLNILQSEGIVILKRGMIIVKDTDRLEEMKQM